MTILLIFLLLLPLTIHASSLEEIPIDHWVYPLIDNLQKRGHFGKLYVANRPYTREEVARYIFELAEMGEDGQLNRVEEMWVDRIRSEFEGDLALLTSGEGAVGEDYSYRVSLRGESRVDLKEEDKELEPAYESIKFGGKVDPDLSVEGEIGGSLQYRDRLIFVDRFQVHSDPINEPSYRIGTTNDRLRFMQFREAYIKGKFGPTSFLFGRTNLVWGNNNFESLTISGISPPFDLLKYNLDIATFRATGFLAFLDGMADSGGLTRRYLYGHRIDWRAASWFQLGFSEVALVTGKGRGIEFSYLNPFVSYQFLQHEERTGQSDTDVYSAINGSVYPVDDLFISGELLIDDIFLFETESNGDFPNQVALSLEAGWTGFPLPESAMLEFDYTRIGSFTYLHRGDATYYSHYGAPIGHPLGPDTDRWRAGLSYAISDDLELEIDYQARRRGENRLEPGVSARGHKGEPFPSGVVEKRKGLGIGVEWFLFHDFLFRGDFSYTRVRNLNNQRGESDSIPNLELTLSYFHNLYGSFSGP